MGYSYADESGWLHHGPSIGGASALMEELQNNHDSRLYPNVKELLTTGQSDNPEGVKAEAEKLAAKIKDADVQSTLQHMARAAAKAKGHISFTH